MRSILSVSFYIKRDRPDSKNEVPIVIRIKLNDERRDMSSGLRIQEQLWDSRHTLVKGNSGTAKQINKLLEASKNKLYEIFTSLNYGSEVFIDDIVDFFQGKNKPREHYLLKLVTEHNEHIMNRIGIDYTKSTFQKYHAMEIRINQFVSQHLQKKDIPVTKLDRKFISDFFLYLKDVHNNQHNSAVKTTKNLKRVLSYAVEQGYISANPFTGFKTGYKETIRAVLTMEELNRIELKSFTIPGMELTRNLFLFQCYTGLSYIDMATLTRKCIVKGADDVFWLEIERRKTGKSTQIPLFPIALGIISKYNKDAQHSPDDLLLPVSHIQHMNAYLKEIGDICGINKNLSTHAGRRTFASTVMLNNGVRIEAVSRMLAHSSIRVTQLYAKVYDQHLIDQTKHIDWLWKKDNPTGQ